MTEFVWCMDSDAAICPPRDPCNPTNDIVIEPQMSVNRMWVTEVELAAIEFPRMQRLIEPCWSRMYFFGSFPMFAHAGNRLQIVDTCDRVYEFGLPYQLNRILSIRQVSPTRFLFTTEHPHRLAGTCQPEILGLPDVTGPQHLEPVCSHVFALEILEVSSLPTEPGSGVFLFSPPERSPVCVAHRLNDELQAQFELHKSGRSMPETPRSERSVRSAGSRSTACSFATDPFNNDSHVPFASRKSYFVPDAWSEYGDSNSSSSTFSSASSQSTSCKSCGRDCLAASGPFCIAYDPCQSRFVISVRFDSEFLEYPRLVVRPDSLDLGFNLGEHLLLRAKPVTATYTPAGTTHIQLTPGNYVIEEMVDEINLRFNACFFLPGSILSIGDSSGTHTITLVPGSYTPLTLATSVSSALAPFGVALRFCCEGFYVFESLDGHTFSLEFHDPTLTTVSFKFGFRPTRYNGFARYQSQDPICPQRIGKDRFNVVISDVQQNLDATSLTFFYSIPQPAFDVSLSAIGVSEWRVVTNDAAIGVQQGDVVELNFDNDALRPRRLAVSSVVSGTEFSVVTADHDETIDPLAVQSVQLVLTPSMSILTSPNNVSTIKPLILGFSQRDSVWCRAECYIRTPFSFRMIPWTYVLLEMVEPKGGSSRIEHRYVADHKTTILAKIVLSYEPELERFYPMRATFFTGMRLERFHFRLLNPDHTLYQLHGQQWRATFRLFSAQSPEGILTGNFASNPKEARVLPLLE